MWAGLWGWVTSDSALNLGTFLVSLSAVFGVVGGVILYWRDQKLRRSKWLAELYKRFYESERYRDIRQRLDFGDLEELEELIRLDQSGGKLDQSQRDLYDRFTDYLNFFEYAVYLEQTGQITDEDLKALFAYYLDNITQVKLVSGYVKRPETGFERLRSRVK